MDNKESWLPMNQDIIFFDVETSSLDPVKGEILEMAAMRVDAVGNVIAHYCDKIRPTREIDPKAAEINGYTEEKWKNSIPFTAALNTLKTSVLLNRPKSFIVVAYYAAFDQRYFTEKCAEVKEDMPFEGRKWIDPFHLAWPLLVAGVIPNQKLTSIAKYFGISTENAHTATGDVEILAQVYARLMKRYMLITEAEGAVRDIGKKIVEKGFELIGGTAKPEA